MKMILALLLALSVQSSFVQASDPADYYRQFNYIKEEFDDGDGEITYQWRWLMTMEEVVVSDLKHIMVNSSLVLLPNNEFILTMDEMFKTRSSPSDEWMYMPNPSQGMCPKVFKGTWSAPVGPLVLSISEASGDRATFDGRPSVKIKVNAPMLSPEVVGKELVYDFGYSNQDISMILGRGGFCPL